MSLRLYSTSDATRLRSQSSNLLRNQSTFSMQMWIKFEDDEPTSRDQYILNAESERWAQIQCANSGVLKGIFTNSSNTQRTITSAASTFSDDTWYHIVYTFASGSQVLWVNGASVATGTVSGESTHDLAAYLQLKAAQNYGRRVQDIAIWAGTALTEANVIALRDGTSTPSDLSATAWWRMNKTSGSFALTDTELDDVIGSVHFDSVVATGECLWVDDVAVYVPPPPPVGIDAANSYVFPTGDRLILKFKDENEAAIGTLVAGSETECTVTVNGSGYTGTVTAIANDVCVVSVSGVTIDSNDTVLVTLPAALVNDGSDDSAACTDEAIDNRTDETWFAAANGPLGMNLSSHQSYNTNLIWKDLFKYAGNWRCFASGGSELTDTYEGGYDANGYPLEIPEEGAYWRIVVAGDRYSEDIGVGHYPAGNYVLLYDGAGTATFYLDAGSASKTAEGRYTFSVASPDNGIQIHLTWASAEDYIHNIRIVPAANESDYVTDPYTANFRTLYEPFSVFRFVDWNLQGARSAVTGQDGIAIAGIANGSITLDASASAVDDYYNGCVVICQPDNQRRIITDYDGTTKVATINANWSTNPTVGQNYSLYKYQSDAWADRTPEGHYNQSLHLAGIGYSGPAWEHIIDICNEMQIDPWICVPCNASDAYVTALATLFYNTLDSNRTVYVEYGNEHWNSVIYKTADWCMARAAEYGGSGSQAYARRCVEVFQLWNDVYSEDDLRANRSTSKLVRILATQAASTSVTDAITDYDGTPCSGGASAADYADALSPAFYTGNLLDATADVTNNTAAGLCDLLDEATYRQLVSGGWLAAQKAKADTAGLRMIGYEGGQHLIADTTAYIRSVAQAGGASSITLAASSSASDDAYNTRWIKIVGGTGSGQVRQISDYTGSTKVADVSSAWDTQPDNTSRYLMRTDAQYKSDTAVRLAAMEDVYSRLLRGWNALVGDEPICLYYDVYRWDASGRGSFIQYYDEDTDDSPPYQAMLDYGIVFPTVTTTAASNETNTSFQAGGNVTDDGGDTVTARGIVWSTTVETPVLADADGYTTDSTGTGAFTSSATGLPAGSTVYFAAYATNSIGTSYGSYDTATTIAGDPATTPVGTVAADGGSITFSWTRAGGWPEDMTVYSNSTCSVFVDGVPRQADVGGDVSDSDETVTVTKYFTVPIYRYQAVFVHSVEGGQAYSDADPDNTRTAALNTWDAITNNSLASPAVDAGRILRTVRPGNRFALR